MNLSSPTATIAYPSSFSSPPVVTVSVERSTGSSSGLMAQITSTAAASTNSQGVSGASYVSADVFVYDTKGKLTTGTVIVYLIAIGPR